MECDKDLKDLFEINGHLLVTTRCDCSPDYTVVKINPIDSMEALKDIFMKNYYYGGEVERDDPFLEELIELVNRHTYTVELLAQHMENSGQTAEEMIEALKKEGILSLNEEHSFLYFYRFLFLHQQKESNRIIENRTEYSTL